MKLLLTLDLMITGCFGFSDVVRFFSLSFRSPLKAIFFIYKSLLNKLEFFSHCVGPTARDSIVKDDTQQRRPSKLRLFINAKKSPH